MTWSNLRKRWKLSLALSLLLLASVAFLLSGRSRALGRDGDPHAGHVGCGILRQLSTDYELLHTAQPGPQPPLIPSWEAMLRKYPLLQFDAEKRVLINARVTRVEFLQGFRAELINLGMNVVWTEEKQGLVSGYLPIDKIAELPKLEHFSAATVGLRPRRRAGSVLSQGDAGLKSANFRTTTGATGAGMTIGVISDSVNRVAPGLPGSQATVDLPAGVNVLLDGPPGSSDEGRAMLEIAHDIAPGAKLAFSTASPTPQVFANSILSLASVAGAKVVIDDIGYPNSPYFNDGVVSQAVDQVVAGGVFYATAAGNDGNTAWVDSWRPMTATVGGINGTFHDLGGGDVFQDFTLAAGDTMILGFQWDSAFLEGGSPLPNFQVANDLAVIVTTPGNTIIPLAMPDNNNLSTDEAFELVQLTNPGPGTLNARMSFQLKSGPAPTMIKWVAFTGAGFADPAAQGQGSSTIYGQVSARGAAAVGAVDWAAPTVSEPYTSLGGNLPIMFDALGNRLPSPEIRIKPEFAAIDGVNTTVTGFSPFFGTSAAVPHAAGVVALLLEKQPTATPAQVLTHLQTTATDIDTPGFDFLSGAGLIQIVSPLPTPTPPIPPVGPGGEPSGADSPGEGNFVGLAGRRPPIQGGEGAYGLGRGALVLGINGSHGLRPRPGPRPTSAVPPPMPPAPPIPVTLATGSTSGPHRPFQTLQGPITDPANNQVRVYNVAFQQTNAPTVNPSSSDNGSSWGLVVMMVIASLGTTAVAARVWQRYKS